MVRRHGPFVFPVRSDRGTRAGRVSASKVARLAGGDGRAGSVCGPIGAVGEAVSAQLVSRARCAVAKTALYGQPEAMANLIRRTLMVTRAPILKSLRRMVPQVASARSVACRASRRVSRKLKRETDKAGEPYLDGCGESGALSRLKERGRLQLKHPYVRD